MKRGIRSRITRIKIKKPTVKPMKVRRVKLNHKNHMPVRKRK